MDPLFSPVNTPLGYSKEAGSQILPYAHAISVIPALLNTNTLGWGGGGVSPGKKQKTIQSQLRALATHTPSWGASVKAPGCKVCHKFGSAIF